MSRLDVANAAEMSMSIDDRQYFNKMNSSSLFPGSIANHPKVPHLWLQSASTSAAPFPLSFNHSLKYQFMAQNLAVNALSKSVEF